MDVSGLVDTLSDDEEIQSASKVLELVTNAWVNEKNCPELLQHETDLIECLLDQVHQMEENLENLKRDDFRVVPHQMELDRIRYLISSYLRIRLEKIEKFTLHVLQRDRDISNEDDRYLSKAEYKFAEDYLNNLKTHCHSEAFKYIPALFHNFGRSDINLDIKPNLLSTVFIKVIKTTNDVLVDGQVVNLNAGSRHLLPYKDVSQLIRNGTLMLI